MLKNKNILVSIIIFLLFTYFSLIFFYYFNFYLKDNENIIQISIYYFLPLIFCISSLIILFTSFNIKINYLTFIISLFIFLFSINIYLSLRLDASISEKVQMAKNKGINFDTRTRSQIISDYRKDNKELYPAIYSNINYSYEFFIENKKLHTLGGISNVNTVTCNEGGQYQIYKSDRYGFNNSDKVHDYDKIDIGILGDSFMQGNCVKREHTLGGFINNKFPKTISIASAGNGSLSNLASLVEYLSDKKPKVVLWFFYAGNDLIEQNDEKNSFSILRKYLEENNFKQNLKIYQKEIDNHLIAISERENPNNLKSRVREVVHFFAFKSLLSELETMIFKIIQIYFPEAKNEIEQLNAEFERDYLIKVLLKAKEKVEGWSGRLITIYIPYQTEMFLEDNPDYFLITNNIFNEIMKKNNINNIDIMSKLLNEKNIKDLYALDMPFSKYNSHHFDKDGYEKISQIILNELETNYTFD